MTSLVLWCRRRFSSSNSSNANANDSNYQRVIIIPVVIVLPKSPSLSTATTTIVRPPLIAARRRRRFVWHSSFLPLLAAAIVVGAATTARHTCISLASAFGVSSSISSFHQHHQSFWKRRQLKRSPASSTSISTLLSLTNHHHHRRRRPIIMAASSTTDTTTTTEPAAAIAATISSPPSLSPLSGFDLRDVVLEASTRDVASTLDLHGIAWLEHINLIVGGHDDSGNENSEKAKHQAEYFYLHILGCTRDAGKSFHVNLGQQQFHLATTKAKKDEEETAQVIAGSIGLAVPSLNALRQRLQEALMASSSSSSAEAKVLQDTQFAVLDDTETMVTVQGPWGNRFHCYQVDDDYYNGGGPQKQAALEKPQKNNKMTNLHDAKGGPYGSRMAVRGQPGIRFVEIVVPHGSSSHIATFYQDVLDCTVQQHFHLEQLLQDGVAVVTVSVGPGVHLVFVEQQQRRDGTNSEDSLLEEAMEAMKGVHICLYTHNFESLYHRLSEKKLIWTNPRFTHLDSCDTWEEAWASRTLRFRYIVDADDKPLLELEHETRPLRHGQYLKVPEYRPMLPAAAVLSSSTNKRPLLSSRVLETLDPCVVLMQELVGQYAPIWNTDEKGGIFSLAQGVVYWKPPPTCTNALRQVFADGDGDENSLLHMYGPDQGIPELIDALETKITTENDLNNHNVMITVGANQAYVNCVLTLLDQESQAVVFAPYYFNHVMAIQMTCGDDAVVVGPTSNDGIPDLDWLKATLQSNPSIRMVTIVNPGNPTGVSLSKENLQRVVDLCREHNVWLVLDCTYEYFTHPSLNHQPLATFGDDDPHVIHIFSFSKSYSLAGYRCGYVVLHKDAEGLYDNMMKVQDTIPIAPPRIAQIAALGALQAGKEWVYEQYGTLVESRQLILDALEPLPTMGGSGSMYVMAQLPSTLSLTLDDDENKDEAIDLIVGRRMVRDYGISIIPGSFCGFDGWIRVCYANLPPQQCRVAAKRLRDGIASIVLANS